MPPSTNPLRRVQELFEAALQHTPQERAAFLDEACGEDDALRADVQSLLHHQHDAPEDFLRPPGVSPSDIEEDARIGRRIGRYLIKQVIASGGMGTVYLAEQKHPRRDVAVKMMHAGLSSRSAASRFKYESEILGRLRHPGVAQVYEAGAHIEGDDARRSTPYFAMEFVPDAQSITQYADDKRLGTRARLELFLQVCEAMQYGHQKGVIHRDIKPANILVDTNGRVKIIDLGIARTTDSDIAVTTVRTDVGQLIGTVQYMSPEQCDADPAEIDTRSDVYAMGVVLYELICEKLPYKVSRTSIVESIRVVREELPLRPSAVRHGLSRNLEAVLLKALEKRRELRYQSAAELAQDICRYLAGEPVSARPPTMWSNVARQIVRRPKTATLIACLLIVAATFVSTELAIYRYNQRPFQARVSEDSSKAQLLAVSGRTLAQWNGPGVCFARLIDRPDEQGGGSVVAVGYSRRATNRWCGKLCVYDTSVGYDEPAWIASVERAEVPQALLALHPVAVDCNFVHAEVFDIFADVPGDEIVATFVHGDWSQVTLRIYDLSGNILFEIWHDGGIGKMRWVSETGLLVVAAGDEYLKFNDTRFRDSVKMFAAVVFALRPKQGHRSNCFLAPLDAGNDSVLAWYRVFLPHGTETSVLDKFEINYPGASEGLAKCVLITVYYKEIGKDEDTDGGLQFLVDEHGEEVPGSRSLHDSYAQDQCSAGLHVFPDPSTVRLVPYAEVLAGIPELSD